MMAENNGNPRVAPNPPAAAEPIKNKQLAECFFDLNWESGQHACRYAECVKKGTTVRQRVGHGYRNLECHLDNNHPSQ